MKTKHMAVIGMAVCFMMMAVGAARSAGIPGVKNGTVTDPSTGLVWLQNANCFGYQQWRAAMNSAANLKSGSCGLKDGSTAGKWRLPTIFELKSRQGNQQGFDNVQSSVYWSSSTDAYNTNVAWYAHMSNGVMICGSKSDTYYVWPVRGGQ